MGTETPRGERVTEGIETVTEIEGGPTATGAGHVAEAGSVHAGD